MHVFRTWVYQDQRFRPPTELFQSFCPWFLKLPPINGLENHTIQKYSIGVTLRVLRSVAKERDTTLPHFMHSKKVCMAMEALFLVIPIISMRFVF